MTFSRTFSIITLACLPNTKSCPCPPCGPQKSHIYFFWCLCTCLMGYYAPIHGSKVKKSKDMTTTFLFVVVAICNTSLIHTIQLSLHIFTFLVSNWIFFVRKQKHWCEYTGPLPNVISHSVISHSVMHLISPQKIFIAWFNHVMEVLTVFTINSNYLQTLLK